MKRNEIETKLENAVSNAAPDVLDNILRACSQKKGTVIKMEQNPNTNKGRNKTLRACIAIAAAAAMILVGVLIGRGAGQAPAPAANVAAIISLDVNPSVELRVDAAEKVLAAESRNADGAAALEGMDLVGTQLNVAVNAIVGSMLKLGYINELANSILISVEGVDGADAQALESKLIAEVEAIFAQSAVGSGAILSQNVSGADDALAAKAEEYGITVGKAALIEEILAGNARHTFEELAGLSINELNLLAENVNLTNVNSVGQASDKAYIGTEAAVAAALQHAGVARADVTNLEVELDCENGRMVYEVEFDVARAEYEYDVDAETAEIIWYEAPGIVSGNNTAGNAAGSNTTGGTQSGTDVIGEEKAKQIAFGHAGVKEADMTALKVELDRDDGVLHYDVDFYCNGYEYDYEIDAVSGAILKHEREQDDDAGKVVSGGTQSGTDVIGEEKAKQIAFGHAGVKEADMTALKVELDRDDGVLHYDVDFYCNGYEYDYEIDAVSGAILKHEREQDDDARKPVSGGAQDSGSNSSGNLIGTSRAKEIALAHAGLSESAVNGLKVELDREDGRQQYEVEFKAGGYEYDYEIDAVNGTILEWDKDYDD